MTKLATGLRTSWRMRSRMLSSAWMIRLRSKMAKTERPSPTRLTAFPAAASPSIGLRSSCIARALYSRIRPSTLHTMTLCASSDISAARRFLSCSMRAFASRTRSSTSRSSAACASAKLLNPLASRFVSADPRSAARCAGLAVSMTRTSSAKRRGALMYRRNSARNTNASGTTSSSAAKATWGTRSCRISNACARSRALRSAPSSSAAAANRSSTKHHAATSNRRNRTLSDIAYSPSICATCAIRSLVEKGLVT